MPEQVSNNRRIAKNTLMLSVRMLFSMLVSLYTSRVVLNALGVVDYGIYNVVGGFVSMFSIVSTALSNAVSRFIAFELGKGDLENLKRVFSTSVIIHMALAAIIVLLTETVGLWFLNCKMEIPADRMGAANWVFQASVFSFVVSLLSVPYNADIIAHERMDAFAYLGIIEVVLKLGIALLIAYLIATPQRLVVYALLLVAVALAMRVMYVVFCKRHFQESSFHWHFDREYLRSITSYSTWNFVVSLSFILKNSGVNVLLNLFFGPAVNTARGLAETVNSAVTSFANNFMTALNPQITKQYAEGNLAGSELLVERGARFSFYLMLFLVIPVFLEADLLLTFWLKSVPAHTVVFSRLTLILALVTILSTTLYTLQCATGELKTYSLTTSLCEITIFPIAYVLLKLGSVPEVAYVVTIVVSFGTLFVRLWVVSRTISFNAYHYVIDVCCRAALVAVLASALPTVAHFSMSSGWLRLLAVTLISTVATAVVVLAVGCTATERNMLLSRIQKLF